MYKNMKWLVAGTAAGLLVMAMAIPALASGPNGTRGNGAAVSQQAGGVCLGVGQGPDESVATLLGLTQEQIQEQRQAGKSLVEIAAGQNVSPEVLIGAIMAENAATIQNMVTAGTLTQEQADLRLAQMKERVTLAVNRTTVGPPEWAGAKGKRGTGMMGQGRNQAACDGTGQMLRTGRNGR